MKGSGFVFFEGDASQKFFCSALRGSSLQELVKTYSRSTASVAKEVQDATKHRRKLKMYTETVDDLVVEEVATKGRSYDRSRPASAGVSRSYSASRSLIVQPFELESDVQLQKSMEKRKKWKKKIFNEKKEHKEKVMRSDSPEGKKGPYLGPNRVAALRAEEDAVAKKMVQHLEDTDERQKALEELARAREKIVTEFFDAEKEKIRKKEEKEKTFDVAAKVRGKWKSMMELRDIKQETEMMDRLMKLSEVEEDGYIGAFVKYGRKLMEPREIPDPAEYGIETEEAMIAKAARDMAREKPPPATMFEKLMRQVIVKDDDNGEFRALGRNSDIRKLQRDAYEDEKRKRLQEEAKMREREDHSSSTSKKMPKMNCVSGRVFVFEPPFDAAAMEKGITVARELSELIGKDIFHVCLGDDFIVALSAKTRTLYCHQTYKGEQSTAHSLVGSLGGFKFDPKQRPENQAQFTGAFSHKANASPEHQGKDRRRSRRGAVRSNSIQERTVDSVKMTPVYSLENVRIRYVTCGPTHVLASTFFGAVYSWGNNKYGKLGLGDDEHRMQPCLVEGFGQHQERAVFVACGYSHSAIVTTVGLLYLFGNGVYGQLGHGTRDDEWKPRRCEFFNHVDIHVKEAALGENFTLVLLRGGKVFSFGTSWRGQLGHGNAKMQEMPKEILTLTKIAGLYSPVKKVVCGSSHCLALTKAGALYSWGYNQSGQLGLGHDNFQFSPASIKSIQDVKKVCAGGDHSAAITEDGSLYVWGCNEHHQLLLSKEMMVSVKTSLIMVTAGRRRLLTPVLVNHDDLAYIAVDTVACGPTSTAVIHNFAKRMNQFEKYKEALELRRRSRAASRRRRTSMGPLALVGNNGGGVGEPNNLLAQLKMASPDMFKEF